MRAIGLSRAMLMGIAMLAAVGMAACTAPNSARPGSSQTATPLANATGTSTTSAAILPASEAPSATPGGSGVQNLVMSSALRSELTALFVADIGIQVSDLPGDGPIPGDAYYAYDPATDTYWAYATFPVSGAAPASVIAAFQEHGQTGLYRKAGAGPWQVTTDSAATFCAELQFFPPAVLTAWALPTTPPPYQTC
jgi:hypothetical protein